MHYPRRQATRDRRSVVTEAEMTHSCSPRCRTSVALWSTGCSPGGITIGRMTATGTVTIYAVQNISSPVDITAGPDGAMWFTSSGNVIGQITTSVTHDQSIHPHLGSGRNNGHHHRPQPGRATKVSFGGTAATIVSDTACGCREAHPRHATRRYSLIRPPTRACLRIRYCPRSIGSGSGFSGAAPSSDL